jgi:hypothetical protein
MKVSECNNLSGRNIYILVSVTLLNVNAAAITVTTTTTPQNFISGKKPKMHTRPKMSRNERKIIKTI